MELSVQRQPTAQQEHVWDHGRRRPEGKACYADSSRYNYRLEKRNSLCDFFLFALPQREEWQGHFKIVWCVSGGQRDFPLSFSIAFNSQKFFFTGSVCQYPQLRKARGKRSTDNTENKKIDEVECNHLWLSTIKMRKTEKKQTLIEHVTYYFILGCFYQN